MLGKVSFRSVVFIRLNTQNLLAREDRNCCGSWVGEPDVIGKSLERKADFKDRWQTGTQAEVEQKQQIHLKHSHEGMCSFLVIAFLADSISKQEFQSQKKLLIKPYSEVILNNLNISIFHTTH